MKELKDELKSLQKEMKSLRDQPQKMMKVQKKVMETNMKYMMQSFRPMLITFIPIILVFGWFTANLAYEPLVPGQEFTVSATLIDSASGSVELQVPDQIELLSESSQEIVDNTVSWTLLGSQGTYFLGFSHAGSEARKEVVIDYYRYAKVDEKFRGSAFKSITLDNQKSTPFGSFSLFGWYPGWLAAYIIFSIVFSMSLRKILKIY